MARGIQLTIDCARPAPLVAFWAAALDYRPEPPPAGFALWKDYWRSIGVPEEELDPDRDNADSIVDPAGVGPRIWFQVVPEPKVAKNRVHLDLDASGGRAVPLAERRVRVDAEVARLVDLGASVVREPAAPGLEHYAVVLADPEGNEFCVH